MDKCTFLENFTEKYESFKLKEPTIDNLIDELSYYESSIPEFFSKNGEATGIRNMYSGIHEMMENGIDKTIKCVDINKSNAIYVEYMDGMIKFINDIKNLNFNGNYVLRYNIGIENYQGFNSIHCIYDNDTFNKIYEVIN